MKRLDEGSRHRSKLHNKSMGSHRWHRLSIITKLTNITTMYLLIKHFDQYPKEFSPSQISSRILTEWGRPKDEQSECQTHHYAIGICPQEHIQWLRAGRLFSEHPRQNDMQWGEEDRARGNLIGCDAGIDQFQIGHPIGGRKGNLKRKLIQIWLCFMLSPHNGKGDYPDRTWLPIVLC